MSTLCPKGHASQEADYCSECGMRIGAARSTGPLTAPTLPTPPVPPTSQPGRGDSAPVQRSADQLTCPDCGTERPGGARFCEVCRHDFTSRAASDSGHEALSAPGMPLAAPATAASTAPATPPAAAPLAAATSPEAAPPAAVITPATVLAAATQAATVAAAQFAGLPAFPDLPQRIVKLSVVVIADATLMKEVDPDNPFPAGAPERVFPLDLAENLVGRRSESKDSHPEIPVNDPSISRRHLKFLRRNDGQFEVVDLNSANGSHFNGKPLEPGVQTLISAGDEITLGMWTRLVIRAR